MKLGYREPSWRRGKIAAYQLQLDCGGLLYAPEDDDGYIRAARSSPNKRVCEHGNLLRDIQREIGVARNISSEKFHPFHFELEEAQARLEEAVSGKASVRGGELMWHTTNLAHLLGGSHATNDENKDADLKYKDGVPEFTAFDSGSSSRGLERQLNTHDKDCFDQQTVRSSVVKDPRVERVCASCGSPNNLKSCARCKTVSYCSVACQKAAWKSHKQLCMELAPPQPGKRVES